jgi:hypothetical protein
MDGGKMTTQEIKDPVGISDNGVRSYIPPTFNFELRNSSGRLIATVSQVVWPDRNLTDYDAVATLSADGKRAKGMLSEYDAGPQARESGIRFTIGDVVMTE